MNVDKHEVNKTEHGLFSRVAAILDKARTNIVRTVNSRMVIAYWLIGREIIEEEQHGSARAEYGKRLIEDLSAKLSELYGGGFSVANLRNFRQFYLTFGHRVPEIHYPLGSELLADSQSNIGGAKLPEKLPNGGKDTRQKFHPDLSWSHYRALMRVESPEARSFYEIEALSNCWNRRELERQINSLLFERLLKSRDKKGLLKLANEGQIVENPIDVIKDPYVLEFLNLPESHRLVESKLEEALITHLQEFLLELGSGFAFFSRQQRLTIDGDHFYTDLVFYHVKLKCYIILDLKVAKLSHQDLGQMQMYVHYYDREVCDSKDNPTIGLILCTDKNDAAVQYVLDEQNRQIFASRYSLVLPNEKELIDELKREMKLLAGAGPERSALDNNFPKSKKIFKGRALPYLKNLFGPPVIPSSLPSYGSPLGGYLSTEAQKEVPVSFPALKHNLILVDIDLSAIAQAKGKLLPLPEDAPQELQQLIKYAQKQKLYYYAGVLFDENCPLETIADEPMKVDKIRSLAVIENLPKETTAAMVGFCPNKKLLYELVKKVVEGGPIPEKEQNRKVIWVLYKKF